MNAFTEDITVAIAVLGGKIKEQDNDLQKCDEVIKGYEKVLASSLADKDKRIAELERELDLAKRKEREKTETKK